MRRWSEHDNTEGLICALVVVPYSDPIHFAVSIPLFEEMHPYSDGRIYGAAGGAEYGWACPVWGRVYGKDISPDLHSAKFHFFLVYVCGQKRKVPLYLLPCGYVILLDYPGYEPCGYIFRWGKVYSHVCRAAFTIPAD